jgi:hypothetical protein
LFYAAPVWAGELLFSSLPDSKLMKLPRFVLVTVLTSSLALSANAQSPQPSATPAMKPSADQTTATTPSSSR